MFDISILQSKILMDSKFAVKFKSISDPANQKVQTWYMVYVQQ
jgi:hypothetical protein